jgi:uncharacterized cupin superfamily protein
MHYQVVDQDDIEETTIEAYYSRNLDTVDDPSEKDEFRNLSLLPIDDALGTEHLQIKLWYFEPGDEVIYHAHTEQEELYYILEGEFSLKLGDPDDPEFVEAGPETFYVAGPKTGHGHRYVGDDTGVVLAVGAPPEFDPGKDPVEFASDS